MKRSFSKWVGWVRIIAFVCVAFGIVVRIGDPLLVSAIRNAVFDFYHQTKPREYTPLPVAILDVDDRSIEALGQWPWPRTRIAEMVDKATQDGAVAIAFDIIFAEPDRLSPAQIAADNPELPPDLAAQMLKLPDNDAILAEAFTRARVIVGQTSVRSSAGNRAEKRDLTDVQFALIGPDPKPFLLRFPDILQNLPELEAAAAGRGLFNARPDADGVFRRVPLVMNVQEEVRLGLTPELLRIATGGQPFAVRTNAAGVEGIILAQQLVPTARDGTVWPYLTPHLRARYVSAGDLLEGTMPRGRLAGHLVLVGTSAIGLEDFRATPLGTSMAGVEIHAQVLENMMAKTLLIRPNYTITVELAVTLLLCTLVIIFAPFFGASALIISSAFLLTAYIAISYYLFYEHRILLDPSFPTFSTALTIILISTVNYLREEKQKRVIRDAFGQYVSPDLVNQLTENQEQLSLGGESRELTLLFSDVRGFTAIAEAFRDDPEGLTRLMNQFLNILSKAILDQNGTIDKFMGDAVMAFWNAPLDNPDHVRSACRAALRMIRDVKDFNMDRMQTSANSHNGQSDKEKAERMVQTIHRLNVGIGINTGQCVVGNMGSDTRFDYTALGDPVNVASRLEGQSRYYGAPIILGQTTAYEVIGEFALLELDMIRVVGKAVPENIFALLGDETLFEDPAFKTAVETNSKMLAAYRAQDWDALETLIDALRNDLNMINFPLDEYIQMYRTRLTELRATPPGPDWDGVYVSSQK
ncbi:CHASE2 domain-containing protein [Sulfitobacter sp. JL08]|uniref:CHASE2 domain-containing protein n=1 Tax=Sulfitobacter sp. JL08 TaxID=2070369 RepID=UPI0013B3AD44|nr:adenylate/guanylate cyclase domain-containing protein [Sulfitobacter sp. JL08]